MSQRLFIALFESEEGLIHAAHEARAKGMTIQDIYSPYPVHGAEEALDLKPSRLSWVCFLGALIGCALGFLFQYWTSAIDWPLNVGGKPFNSSPAFVPVAFELTVLVGGLSAVAALLLISGLLPGRSPSPEIPGVTDDRFGLAISTESDRFSETDLRRLCDRHEAVEYVYTEKADCIYKRACSKRG